MFTISQIAQAFSQSARHSNEDAATYLKLLQNLSQRHAFPPAGQKGNAYTYSLPTAIALCIAAKAFMFGLNRLALEKLVGQLLRDGEEAIARTKQGEVFCFHVAYAADADGLPEAWADWKRPESRASNAIDLHLESRREYGRLSFQNWLIADILAELES